MIQKDYDFLITGNIGFGSRVPICGAVICGGCFVKKGAQLAAAQSVMPQILSEVGLFFFEMLIHRRECKVVFVFLRVIRRMFFIDYSVLGAV